MSPFVVFSLPRSRSAWLSVVLAASGSLVGHDIGIESDTPEDFISNLISRGGTCETGAAFAWKEIKRALPSVKFAVVFRDPEEVIESLWKQDLTGVSDEIYARHEQLIEISKQPNVFSCNFNDLENTDLVGKLYQHCTDKEPPFVWINKMQEMNVQINFSERLQRLSERREQIAKLKHLVKDKSGLRLQVEPWSEELWADTRHAAESHFEEVDGGVEPNRPFDLDTDIMTHMQNTGSLLIVTARQDGKFVGYFTWQISLDVESKGLLIAQQGAWYVYPGNPRVAVKLFDKSIEELRKRGVQCIFPHHRLQGRGANLGKFFEKRGAKLMQHTYSLWIGN